MLPAPISRTGETIKMSIARKITCSIQPQAIKMSIDMGLYARDLLKRNVGVSAPNIRRMPYAELRVFPPNYRKASICEQQIAP